MMLIEYSVERRISRIVEVVEGIEMMDGEEMNRMLIDSIGANDVRWRR